jgi:hypothetical protein
VDRRPSTDTSQAGAQAYSLQIAASNLKNFQAENPKAQVSEDELPQVDLPESDLPEKHRPQPERTNGEPEKVVAKSGDDPSLAAALAGLLAKGPIPAAEPPRLEAPTQPCAGGKRRPGQNDQGQDSEVVSRRVRT